MVHSHSQCVLEECPRRGKWLTTHCKMTTDKIFYMMSILGKNMKKTRRIYIKILTEDTPASENLMSSHFFFPFQMKGD